MKLKNKKTGQKGNFIINKDHFECVDLDYVPEYRSLAELWEEWSDCEEPKEFWMINAFGDVETVSGAYTDDMIDELREIDNYFETKEEAELAVRKLQAWKRLKDNGFRFESAHDFMKSPLDEIQFEYNIDKQKEVYDDICIILGGE